jgi:hypothetical protein
MAVLCCCWFYVVDWPHTSFWLCSLAVNVYEIITNVSGEKFPYEEFFHEQITRKKKDHSYRVFKKVNRLAAEFPGAYEYSWGKRPITVWCSNDYLGMSCHPEVKEAVRWGAVVNCIFILSLFNYSPTTPYCLLSLALTRSRANIKPNTHGMILYFMNFLLRLDIYYETVFLRIWHSGYVFKIWPHWQSWR